MATDDCLGYNNSSKVLTEAGDIFIHFHFTSSHHAPDVSRSLILELWFTLASNSNLFRVRLESTAFPSLLATQFEL
jgi:hypothetical protein